MLPQLGVQKLLPTEHKAFANLLVDRADRLMRALQAAAGRGIFEVEMHPTGNGPGNGEASRQVEAIGGDNHIGL